MQSTLTPVASLRGKHITTATQFTRDDVDALVQLALAMRARIDAGEVLTPLRGRVMTPLFFEDSSRTLSSFCAAMLRLGGGVVNFKVESSSVNKGETLPDTVRTLDAYSDVLVLRHPSVGALDEAVHVATHPVLNAGNGAGEHPTQSLLDVLTMQAELGRVDGLTIALIGDLKMGRTVHSLLQLLVRNYDLRKVYLVAPAALQMPDDVLARVQDAVRQRHIALEQVHTLSDDVVADCDVLYATRLQKERFVAAARDDAAALAAFAQVQQDLRIDRALLTRAAKSRMIVMHPLPRVDELSSDVDDDPRAAYFRQMRYGLFMRMAILYSVLA